MTGYEQSPRSEHGGSSSGSPRHSSRGKSLDMELRNAPCYHAAIMRLLPSSMRRALTLHHTAVPAPVHAHTISKPHHRECLCDPDRRHYRKDWRTSFSPPPPPPALPSQETHPLPRTSSPLLDTNHSFRSGTVYLEVKLVELLSQRKHDLESTRRVADARCFEACWQLLEELSRMKTPFAQVFSTIFKELDKSVHSSYVAVKQGSITSSFQFVPYFELICKLGDQKVEIEAERENLESKVLVCQAEIGCLEQDVEVSNQKLQSAEGFGREMETLLSTVLDALERILGQIRTLQGEMLQLKRNMQKARVEQAKAHEMQYEQMVRKEHFTKLEENYKSMLQELQEAQAELDKARNQAFDSAPKEELGAATAKVSVLEKTLSELQVKADQQIATSGELTPRPVWKELLFLFKSHEYSEKPTAELLVDICKHNVYLTHNLSRLHEDCATAQASFFKKYRTVHNKLHLEDYEQNAVVESQSTDINVTMNEVMKSQDVSESTSQGKSTDLATNKSLDLKIGT